MTCEIKGSVKLSVCLASALACLCAGAADCVTPPGLQALEGSLWVED